MPAGARRSASEATPATMSGTVANNDTVYTWVTARALSAGVSSRSVGERSSISASLLAEAVEHRVQLHALIGRERTVGVLEQRRDDGGARTVEEGAEQV